MRKSLLTYYGNVVKIALGNIYYLLYYICFLLFCFRDMSFCSCFSLSASEKYALNGLYPSSGAYYFQIYHRKTGTNMP